MCEQVQGYCQIHSGCNKFHVYRHINPNHEIIAISYYCVMQHLALIKEPLVNDWKDNQIQNLIDKTI
jgi:hypothetical protein